MKWPDETVLSWFPESAQPEIQALMEAAQIGASETFGPFNDVEDSEFFAAEGLSPESTWEQIAEQVSRVCGLALTLALAGKPITPELICDLHRRIFGEWFPDRAGRLRSREDRVEYSIVIGTRAKPERRTHRGTDGRRIPKRLARLCDDFNEAASAIDELETVRVEDLIAPAVKLYCKLLSTHPFIDGNGRVAFVVLQYALIRVGLIAVALPNYEEHQWALGQALRVDGKQTYVVFEQMLVDKLGSARY